MKTNAFVRQLASNKRTVRENALATLKKFLSTKSKADKISITELNKLWKGLFYTMWFCDKPRPQQRLANDLAKLFSECIVDEQFCNFVESFWTIMIKEWRELDKWRLDKYLMLMRYVVRECFVKMDVREWDEEAVCEYLSVMKRLVLKDDSQIPRAITYHIIDVWVDEIDRVLFPSEEDEEEETSNDSDSEQKTIEEKIEEKKAILEEKKVPVALLLEPFKGLSGKGHSEALVAKIRVEVLDDERLHELGIDTSLLEQKKAEDEKEEDEEDDDEDDDEEEWTGFGN